MLVVFMKYVDTKAGYRSRIVKQEHKLPSLVNTK